ncbi:DUF5959 family protein [Streptomyces sp. NPDC049577]|uniref:DUF5959 family protein n=1 Tax=Streptomyces sp. NPDC049577 TaxID=3155153 RepID=UPI00343137D4
MHDESTAPAAQELIRLAAYRHDVLVTLTGEVHPQSGEAPYYVATVEVSGDLVNLSRPTYVNREDIEEWAQALDRIDEAFIIYEGEPDSVDWPASGQDIYLRVRMSGDPCAVELRDPNAFASVRLSCDLDQEWIEASRARVHAVLERLGERPVPRAG